MISEKSIDKTHHREFVRHMAHATDWIDVKQHLRNALRTMKFHIDIEASTGKARAAEFHTSRNVLHTPCFMPVGTHGGVTGLTPAQLTEIGAEILVCNAFRLSEKPGEAILSKFENLHEFMAWDKTILTDSGGFQSRLREHAITEQGIQFYDERVKVSGPPKMPSISSTFWDQIL